MQFPEEVLRICEQAARDHADIRAAAEQAARRFYELDGHAELVDALVRHALYECVSDFRHQSNVRLKKAAGLYGGPAKVKVGDEVKAAYRSYFDQYVAGHKLGQIVVKELPALAAAERAQAGGHVRNADFFEALYAAVPEGKRDLAVGSALTEKQAKAIGRKFIQKQVEAA